jgi:hypothetical protein
MKAAARKIIVKSRVLGCQLLHTQLSHHCNRASNDAAAAALPAVLNSTTDRPNGMKTCVALLEDE